MCVSGEGEGLRCAEMCVQVKVEACGMQRCVLQVKVDLRRAEICVSGEGGGLRCTIPSVDLDKMFPDRENPPSQ